MSDAHTPRNISDLQLLVAGHIPVLGFLSRYALVRVGVIRIAFELVNDTTATLTIPSGGSVICIVRVIAVVVVVAMVATAPWRTAVGR